jgi:hypothetical protein
MTASQNTVVFLGPTLQVSEAEQLVAAEFRAPAAMGDITRAVVDGFETIVLVDGVFESGPSVWHKEILWALSRDIAVIGVSSMGALRAAELCDFGMLGHGSVFADFISGRLQDDDEVAVLHGPEETGWVSLTDAMVDVRGYANAALEQAVLSSVQASEVVTHAKAMHFKQRRFLSSCRAVLETTTFDIEAWFHTLPAGAKESDCRDLLSNIGSVTAEARRHSNTSPGFSPTVYLSRLQEFGFQF